MKLREIRVQRGLSGYKVAEILRISPQYYYEIERGEKKLSAEMVAELASFYDVTMEDLLTNVEATGDRAKSIEEEWPEVARVLRRGGKSPTEKERKRIAKIIQLAIQDTDEEEG